MASDRLKQSNRLQLKTSGVQARTVLWYLTFFGMAIDYMNLVSLNITILDMVSPMVMSTEMPEQNVTEISDNSNCISNCTLSLSAVNISSNTNTENKNSGFSLERLLLDTLKIDYNPNGFTWNTFQKGQLLGAVYWVHFLGHLPSGILVRKYGTKIIFGWATLMQSIIAFLIPISLYIDYRIGVFLRIVQGIVSVIDGPTDGRLGVELNLLPSFFQGFLWPSMHFMVGKWILPNDRSKFMSAFIGLSVGSAISYPLFGFIMSVTSWEWVFHLCGVVGIVWFIGWQYFVYDSPAKHPRIDPAEKELIEESLFSITDEAVKLPPAPWGKILTSRGVWMNAIGFFGGIWNTFTLLTQGPSYFKFIHNQSTGMTGLLCGIPYLVKMIYSYVSSMFFDHVLKMSWMSRTNVRKLSGACTLIGQGLFAVGIAFSGHSIYLAFMCFSISIALHGAVSSSMLASLADLSPNFSSITLAICLVLATPTGYISATIVSLLTVNQTLESWQYVFGLSGGIAITSGILYVLFSVSELQNWNSTKQRFSSKYNQEEAERLQE